MELQFLVSTCLSSDWNDIPYLYQVWIKCLQLFKVWRENDSSITPQTNMGHYSSKLEMELSFCFVRVYSLWLTLYDDA